MKIAVIGAGIVGICTAWELAADGHAVTVYERNASVAEEASFACAGNLSPSLAHPLAFAPLPPASRLRALVASSPIRTRRGAGLAGLRWLHRWKGGAAGYRERLDAARQLASYSLERLQALSLQGKLSIEQSQGQMLLFPTAGAFEAYQERFQLLKELGVGGSVVTPEQARVLEPALAGDLPLHSAICYPQDGLANCRQFAHALKDQLQENGVALHFGTRVSAIAPGGTVQLQTDTQGTQEFDHAVLCSGAADATALVPALQRLGLARLWSYTVSAQIREPLNAPRSAVLDWPQQVCINRLGARVRVSGGAELGGQPGQHARKTIERLYHALQSHFPGSADFSRSVQTWKGCSLFSPDALPLVGASGHSGLWLNLAHGHNGWSMACGAARLLADQLQGLPGAVDATRLAPARLMA